MTSSLGMNETIGSLSIDRTATFRTRLAKESTLAIGAIIDCWIVGLFLCHALGFEGA